MTLGQLDQRLDWLRSAATTIGARLVDIENDTTRQMLEQATLRDTTAEQWAMTRQAILDVWSSYRELTSLVARANDLRGTKRAISRDRQTEVHLLLTSAAVELAGGARVSAADLVAQMSDALTRVEDVIARAASAWDDMVPRLRDARTAVTEIEASARALGSDDIAELAELRSRLTVLAHVLVEDPLSVDITNFDAVNEVVARLRWELAATADLRARFDERMSAARVRLGQLTTLLDETRAAHHDVNVKIAGSSGPLPLEGGDGLNRRLESVADLGRRGEWREARRSLQEWDSVAAARLDEAQQLLARIRAPIETRNELRSRLEAYHVKAARMEVVEEPSVAEAYEAARAVLYTAPTDLTAAAELVTRYQHLLSTVSEGVRS